MEAVISLREHVLTETYKDTKNLIYNIVWAIHRIYGGDVEALEAQANFLFIKAYDTYKEDEGEFSTWLYHTIYRGLQTFQNKFILNIRPKTTTYCELMFDFVDTSLSPNEWIDILDEFGVDAKEVISILIDMPEEVRGRAVKKGGKPQNIRCAVREYLLYKIGWNADRIWETFYEIREVMGMTHPKDKKLERLLANE